MSSGVSANHGAGVQNLPPGVIGAGSQADKIKSTGKTKSADHVGRGFSTKNSISHQEGRSKAQRAVGQDRTVRLPPPLVDPAKAATPEMQAQISQTIDTTEMLFTFDELLNQLTAEETDEAGEDSALGSSIYGAPRKKRMGQGQQGGGDSMGRNPGGQNQMLDFMPGSKLVEAAKNDPLKLLELQNETMDAFDRIMAIESAPPDVMQQLKADSGRLAKAMLSGDIEDVARILSEVQTKLADTRIKFDEQAIRTSRLKRQQVHKERIGKLSEALEKMKEAKKAGIVGKIFGAIATALAVVVAAVTIATGVGAKAGIMLIMAATIMVAMTVSQNTGDWMTNLGGLIKDDKMQLVMGVAWAILAAALSLGAGIAGSAAKAPADAATTAVQQSTTAAQEATKNAVKVATDSVDEVAEQATKIAVKSAKESAKEAAKASADAAKETAKETAQQTAKETTKATAETASKETAKQMAEVSKKTMYFRRAAHIARFTEGGAMAADGGSQIHAAKARYEGEMYQADAQEDLAFLTKMQLQMEDWMEAIQRALQEISEGQQIASDMLSQAQQNKFTIARNI